MNYDAYIGRQQIYDRNLDVFAYELLYRSRDGTSADVQDGNRATSQVILSALSDFGLDGLVGKKPAFINFTRWFLVNHTKIELPADRVVIELLEDITLDDEILLGAQLLSARGFKLALDDFIFDERADEKMIDILRLVNYVKVELEPDDDAKRLKQKIEPLRKFNVKILAEKVETREQYQACYDLGADLFQGYYFSKPEVLRQHTIPSNQAALMRLLNELARPDSEIEDLVRIVQQDVSLTLRLMRYLNSAFLGLPRKTESLREAIVYLGFNHVRSMALLLSSTKVSNKQESLLRLSLSRSKMCENLVDERERGLRDRCFMVGMLSTLDLIMPDPLPKIIKSLPISDSLTSAVLRHEGQEGANLAAVLAYENSDWDALRSMNHSPETITKIYLQSLKWAEEATMIFKEDDKKKVGTIELKK